MLHPFVKEEMTSEAAEQAPESSNEYKEKHRKTFIFAQRKIFQEKFYNCKGNQYRNS